MLLRVNFKSLSELNKKQIEIHDYFTKYMQKMEKAETNTFMQNINQTNIPI